MYIIKSTNFEINRCWNNCQEWTSGVNPIKLCFTGISFVTIKLESVYTMSQKLAYYACPSWIPNCVLELKNLLTRTDTTSELLFSSIWSVNLWKIVLSDQSQLSAQNYMDT